MHITNLPNELLHIIVGHLSSESDLFHVAQTSHLLSQIALLRLYQYDEVHGRYGGITQWAACHGRVDILQRAAKCGISIAKFDLACHAACRGHSNVLDLVAASRGNVPFTPDELSTLVEEACAWPRLDILTRLFEDFGATINPQRPWECLANATRGNCLACVKILLDRGADPARISTEETALEIAAQEGYADIANLLLDHGANVHDQMNRHFSPMHLAAMHGRVDVLTVFWRYGAHPGVPTVDGSTPLRLAIRYCQNAAAGFLMRETQGHGADTQTLLSVIHRGSAELVQLHLQAGVPAVPPATKPNESLLYVAARRGSHAVASMLLDAGVNIEVGNLQGDTPLFAAVEKNHPQTVNLLLRRGANPNVVGSSGLMPLHVAAMNGLLDISTALLNHGANSAAETPHDKATPLHLACASGNIQVVQCLLQRGHRIESVAKGNGISCLHMAALCGHLSLTQWLLRTPAGAELLNSRDHTGRTPLFIAAREGKDKIVKELLASRANTRRADYFGSMPIFAAVRNGHSGITEDLLAVDPWLFDSKDRVYGSHDLWHWANRCGSSRLINLLRRFAREYGKEEPRDAQDVTAVGETSSARTSKRPCDVCARRFNFDAATRCTICCGGEFYMCVECTSNASCLDASHPQQSAVWVPNPTKYIADKYKDYMRVSNA